MQLSEQEQVRRKAMEELLKLGIDPYPPETYERTHQISQIQEGYNEKDQASFNDVSIAGRIMSRRIMGSASFAELQDDSGRMQIYVRRDDICPDDDKTFYNTVFKRLLDIGDFVGVRGHVFLTKTGELSVYVKELRVLAKSLRPLPVVKESTDEKGNLQVHDAFADAELKYRQRYVDLVVNPDVRESFRLRTRLIDSIRTQLNGKGYLEVETPILQPIYGGALAKPFKTHHNKLDMTLYLRVANELYLKRLIVGGYEGVFEFSKDFRNEGMSRYHNPEFTQVELYVAYKDYVWMMELVEEMIEQTARDLHGTTEVTVGEKEIDFKRPWPRFTMYEIIQKYTGVDISEMNENQLKETAKSLKISIDATMGKGKIIDEIFEEKCEPQLIQPTFITDYPIEMSPLAKKHRTTEGLVERFEAFANGKEICNAFTELNDPLDQRKRFEDQLDLGRRGDEEAMTMDEDFLRALEYGMPPTAGLGVGIDRLAMMLTNQNSIQDVIFFPQMRPEKREVTASDEDYRNIGIREDLIPVIQKLGINSINQFKAVAPNKLFNDICGMRKKMKLGEVKNPTLEEVEGWVND